MLPPLSTLEGPSAPDSALSKALATLFEPSNILFDTLEPQIHQSLLSGDIEPTSYPDLIDAAVAQIQSWETHNQAKFVEAHPRIGESKNLSVLSAKEQGATTNATPTPPEVLARLAHLNACYEKRYPGLRYIIFVNGRSRAAIAEIMEEKLGFEHSLSPNEPPIDAVESVNIDDEDWLLELKRAVGDVGRIAHHRLKALESS